MGVPDQLAREDTVEVITVVPQERMSERIVEPMGGYPVPPTNKGNVKFLRSCGAIVLRESSVSMRESISLSADLHNDSAKKVFH